MAPVFGRGRGRRCSVEVGVRRASVGVGVVPVFGRGRSPSSVGRCGGEVVSIPSLQRLFDRS
jgi:hypothetical protein